MDFLNPELRVLGETDGLPKLPDMTYFLWIRRGALVPLTRHVYDLLTRSMSLTEPGRRT